MRFHAVTSALALLAAVLAGPADATDFARTCSYFENVAYNDRFTRDHQTFRMRLADDCADALAVRSNARPGSVRHAMSDNYLQRLENYRWVMIGMARDRFRASRTGAAVELRPVSRTGAFLIARTMGITETQVRWRDWRQAMAEGRVIIR